MRKLAISALLLIMALSAVSEKGMAQTRRLGVGAYAGYAMNMDFSKMFGLFNGGAAGAVLSYGASNLALEGGIGFAGVEDPFVTRTDKVWKRDAAVRQYRASVLYSYSAVRRPEWGLGPALKASSAFTCNPQVAVDEYLTSYSVQAGCTGSYHLCTLKNADCFLCPAVFAGADYNPGCGWAPSFSFGIAFAIGK